MPKNLEIYFRKYLTQCCRQINGSDLVLFQYNYQTFLVTVNFCILWSDLVKALFVLIWKLLVIVQLAEMEMAKLEEFSFSQLNEKKQNLPFSFWFSCLSEPNIKASYSFSFQTKGVFKQTFAVMEVTP